MRADFNVTTARAEQRDRETSGSEDDVRRRYRERYVLGQRLYLARVVPERWASVVVDNNNLLQRTIVRAG